jgi:hypothetical protein
MSIVPSDIIPIALPVVVLSMLPLGLMIGRQRARENLSELAQRLGLQIRTLPAKFGIFPQLPLAEGSYRGREVRIFGYKKMVGNHRMPLSGVAAKYASGYGFTLQMGPQFILFRIFSAGAARRNLTGDAEFDQSFSTKTNDPVVAQNLLTPEIRRELLEARRGRLGYSTRLAIGDGEVRYTMRGGFSSRLVVDALTKRLELVCDLAEKMGKHRQTAGASREF